MQAAMRPGLPPELINKICHYASEFETAGLPTWPYPCVSTTLLNLRLANRQLHAIAMRHWFRAVNVELSPNGIAEFERLAASSDARTITSLRIGAPAEYCNLSESGCHDIGERLKRCLQKLCSLQSLAFSFNRLRDNVAPEIAWGAGEDITEAEWRCLALFLQVVPSEVPSVTELTIQVPDGQIMTVFFEPHILTPLQADWRNLLKQVGQLAIWSDDRVQDTRYPTTHFLGGLFTDDCPILEHMSVRYFYNEGCYGLDFVKSLELASVVMMPCPDVVMGPPELFNHNHNPVLEEVQLDNVVVWTGHWRRSIFKQLEQCSNLRYIQVHNLGSRGWSIDGCGDHHRIWRLHSRTFFDSFHCFNHSCDFQDVLAFRDLLMTIRERRLRLLLPVIEQDEKFIKEFAGWERAVSPPRSNAVPIGF